MRVRVLSILLLACLASGCRFSPGQVSVNVEWAEPAEDGAGYVSAKLVTPSGERLAPWRLLASTGPVQLAGDSLALEFPPVPNNDALAVIVEIHRSSDPRSIVTHDGISRLFSMQPGVVASVTVRLSRLESGPDTAIPGAFVYSRIPWGSQSTSGQPLFTLTGHAHAVAPGAIVVCTDGPEVPSAAELGRTVADAEGGFVLTIGGPDRPAIYVGVLDAAGIASHLSLVHEVEWRATFNAKRSGSLVENPNRIELTEAFVPVGAGTGATQVLAPLALDPQFTREAESYAGMLEADDQNSLAFSGGMTWRVHQMSPTPSRRYAFSMAYDAVRGKTVLFGGCCTGVNFALNETWEFDGDKWVNVTPSGLNPPARGFAAMSYDARRGVVVLFGGMGDLGVEFGDTWEWDGTSWKDVTPAQGGPPGRLAAAMSYDGEHGESLLFGGGDVGGHPLRDTWAWNGTAWRAISLSIVSPSARAGAAMTFNLQSRHIELYGGESDGTLLSDFWEWDGSMWSAIDAAGAGPGPRFGASLVYDSKRRLTVLIGGCAHSSFTGDCDSLPDDTWERDGEAWHAIEPSSARPAGRHSHQAVFDAAIGAVLLFGGCSRLDAGTAASLCTDYPDDSWLWDGKTWTLNRPSDVLPTSIALQSGVYNRASNSTFVFGGCSSFDSTGVCEAVLDRTFEWNGIVWRDLSGQGRQPPARLWASMAYDDQRDVIVLFGGCAAQDPSDRNRCTQPLHDTWEWADGTWKEISATPSPPARYGHAMTYDAARGQVVLFGGGDGAFASSDTWLWDGSTWQNPSPNGRSPAPRYLSGMTYDTLRRRVVLFGGGVVPRVSSDTWEWDGEAWHDVSPSGASPASRLGAGLVYDPVRGVSLLSCGYGWPLKTFSDTWQWDGEHWSDVTSSFKVLPGLGPVVSATYDVRRSTAVLYGGASIAEMASLPDQRVAAVAHFDLAAAQLKAGSIRNIRLVASAEGVGGSVADPLQGAVLSRGWAWALWDAGAGIWQVVGEATPVHDDAPRYQRSTLAITAPEAEKYVSWMADQAMLSVALFPRLGRGGGSARSEIDLDSLDLQVTYVE